MDLLSIKDKVCIVTGANTGIGQGIAIGFVKAGAKVLGVGRSSMDDTIAKVKGMDGEFVPFMADLGTTEKIEDIIQTAKSTFGKIDVLVNNAGTIRRDDAIDFTEKDWDDVMNINTKTLFFLSQAVARVYIEQGTGGKIINIASMLSYQGGIRVPAYTTSKSGVLGLTRALANEWAKHKINVNAIAPGYIVTNNTAALVSDKARYESILERIPAGRWGQPEDLAGSAIFLASDASNYVHGFTLAVDGGWLAR